MQMQGRDKAPFDFEGRPDPFGPPKEKSVEVVNKGNSTTTKVAKASDSNSVMSSLAPPQAKSSSTSKLLYRLRKYLLRFDRTRRFYLFILVLPTVVALWYASAILMPPSWREKCPLLIWTDSAQSRDADGQFVICPRPSICSEGAFQVFLISVARLTAFASYVVQGIVFASKMHSTIHFLSQSYAATMIPFESLHHVHALTGSTYAGLALIHTFAHLLRWGVRSELGEWCSSTVGLSGIFAMLSMAAVVFVMSPWGKKLVIGKNKKKLTFENRFTSHWIFFWALTFCLCLHVKRTRQITLVFL